jgi:sugar O-acyltransferase (sialic acid O-acetyltransferase NeuD family)
MKKIAIIGYSGHAFVATDILLNMGYNIIGYFEKKEAINNPFNFKYLGNENETDLKDYITGDIHFFVAIGDNSIRREITSKLASKKIITAKAISPSANVSAYTEIGNGSMISLGVCINAISKIGIGVIINTGAIVEHECSIGDFAHIAPGAVLAGNVSIGQNSFIGANSVIKQGVSIGNNVIVGAGSVVLKDIPDNELWAGNPAKKLQHNG